MTTLPAPKLPVLSIFFPMWNEEDYIRRTINATTLACQTLVDEGDIADYELVITNDASTDATPVIADELAAADSRIRVVHHPVNRKLGGSIKTGFAHATGDIVLYTDADLPFDLAEIKRALRIMATYEADIIAAYRLDRTVEGPRRAVYSFVYNGLIAAAFGVRVRDVNFAFKLVRSRVLEHVQLRSEGSFVDAGFIVRASRLGFRIVQIGVDYFPRTRGISTLSSPAVIRRIVREMSQLRGELKSVQPLDHSERPW